MPEPDPTAIAVSHLVKSYAGVTAVNDISFTVAQGEILGLLGPNGAGKSTTMRILTGYMPATSGTVSVCGFPVTTQPDEVKRRVGYMPDSVGFYDNLTGRDNLRYTAKLCGLRGREIDERIDAAAKRVKLDYAMGKDVRTYSRGMRQRLGIAEILMKGASIAILDEPTGGLDPQATREFLELIRSLKHDGMTILLSSHLLEMVQSICDRVALFNRGKIGLMGKVEDLMQNVLGGSHVIRVEATGAGVVEAIGKVPGVARVTPEGSRLRVEASADVRGDIARAVVQAGGDLKMIDAGEASLEDVYTRYFEGIPNAA